MSRESEPPQPSKLDRTLTAVRSSSRPDMKAVKPQSRADTPTNGDDWRESIRRVEDRQVKVVDLLVASIETNQELIVRVEESLKEDGRVRRELAEARNGYRRMRVAVYSLAGVLLIGSIAIVLAFVSAEASRRQAIEALTINKDRLITVERHTDRALKVLLKQAQAHAASVEADVSLSPSADTKALTQAVELEEQAARAQIEVAKERKQAPSPEAKKALKHATEKMERLRKPVQFGGDSLDAPAE